MSKPARPPRRSRLLVQGAVAGGIAVMLPGVALTIAILMCPVIVYYSSEKTEGHPISRAMALCGSTAIFHPLRTLWEHDGSLDVALDLLSDPSRPLLAWVACAAGWLLCETAQIATRLASQAKTNRRVALLEQEEAELKAEWIIDTQTTAIPGN